MRRVLAALAIAAVPVVGGAQTYPRTLAATAEATGASATATGTFTIHVDQLMTDRDFNKVTTRSRRTAIRHSCRLRAATPVG